MTVSFAINSQPSKSKGWGRYRATCAAGRLVQSRTGNEWVSAPHTGDAAPGEQISVVLQVMLRVGKGGRAREEISDATFQLVAEEGASCEIEHRPGSQGLRLQISGARPA